MVRISDFFDDDHINFSVVNQILLQQTVSDLDRIGRLRQFYCELCTILKSINQGNRQIERKVMYDYTLNLFEQILQHHNISYISFLL